MCPPRRCKDTPEHAALEMFISSGCPWLIFPPTQSLRCHYCGTTSPLPVTQRKNGLLWYFGSRSTQGTGRSARDMMSDKVIPVWPHRTNSPTEHWRLEGRLKPRCCQTPIYLRSLAARNWIKRGVDLCAGRIFWSVDHLVEFPCI